jgi:hypothetical protein
METLYHAYRFIVPFLLLPSSKTITQKTLTYTKTLTGYRSIETIFFRVAANTREPMCRQHKADGILAPTVNSPVAPQANLPAAVPASLLAQ